MFFGKVGLRCPNDAEATDGFQRVPAKTVRRPKTFQRFQHPSSYKFVASNGFGKRAFIWMISVLPLRLESMTGTSPQNSQMSWRQAPQGGVSESVSVTTAMASKPRSPSLMALKMATRSAQTVRPYVAFSTLQPPKMRPEVARRAAPTRKLE